MGTWWRALIELALRWWTHRQTLRTLKQFKSDGIKTYLKVLQGARFSAIGVVSLLVALQLMCFGLVVMAGVGIYLAPLETETKLWMGFGMGAALFALPLIVLCIFLSERLWYKISGAERMVEQILKDKAS